MRKKSNVLHNLYFWLSTNIDHPVLLTIKIFFFSFLSFLSSYLGVVIISSIMNVALSFSLEKVIYISLLAILMLILRSYIELIDGKLVLMGSMALNRANKTIVVPALTEIKYCEYAQRRTQVLLAEIQKLIRSGDSSKLGQVFRVMWNFTSSLLGFVLLFGIFARLSLTSILFIVFIFVLSAVLRKKLLILSMERHNDQMPFDMSLSYIERVQTDKKFSKDIRVYDWKKVLKERHDRAISGKLSNKIEEEKALETGKLISMIGRTLSLLIVVLAILSRGRKGVDFKIEEITFLFLSINSIWSWLERAVLEWENLSQASNDISKFVEVKEASSVEQRMTGDVKETDDSSYILFDSISFGYSKDELIFDDFSLSIKQGERIGVVGINGSGKSTLTMLLLGLLEPSKGQIFIEGKSLNEKERRKYFSPVFQYIRMYPSVLGEIISSGESVTEELRERILCTSSLLPIKDVISALPQGLETPLVSASSVGAVDLSGGENQWVMILRALIKDSPVLVFDEINSALDSMGEEALYSFFDNIGKDKTIVFISHRLSFKEVCSRIILLDKGKIVEDGSPTSLMEKKGEFYRLFMKEKKESENAG